MSKIEDDTTRSGRGRSDAPTSISDADDGSGGPIVVPASDDWSVDDDDSNGSRANHANSNNASSNHANSNSGSSNNGNGTKPSGRSAGSGSTDGGARGKKSRADRGTGSTRRVTRLLADDSDSDTADDSGAVDDLGPGDFDSIDDSGPIDGPLTGADTTTHPVDGGADDRAVTGLVPIVITEQTQVEPLVRSGSPDIDRDHVDHAFDDPWNGGGWSDMPVQTDGTPASIPMQSAPPPMSRRRRVRRVNRILRHIDPWSVFKVGLLFSLIGYLIFMTSGVLLWGVASRSGTLPNIERWLTRYGWETFTLDGAAIFKNAAVAGLFAAVGATGAMVMFATVFNLVSDAIGGIRVSVLEEEVIAVDPDDNPGMGTMVVPSHHQATDNWAIEDF